jgi:hypothetical protein
MKKARLTLFEYHKLGGLHRLSLLNGLVSIAVIPSYKKMRMRLWKFVLKFPAWGKAEITPKTYGRIVDAHDWGEDE